MKQALTLAALLLSANAAAAATGACTHYSRTNISNAQCVAATKDRTLSVQTRHVPFDEILTSCQSLCHSGDCVKFLIFKWIRHEEDWIMCDVEFKTKEIALTQYGVFYGLFNIPYVPREATGAG